MKSWKNSRIEKIIINLFSIIIFFLNFEKRISKQIIQKINLIPNEKLQINKIPQLPLPIRQMLATREVRLQHYMWHHCRNRWLTLHESERNLLRDNGWEPPRPSLDRSGNPIKDNNSGEDFLYMHRQMVEMVNKALQKNITYFGSRIVGWTEPPEPGDPLFPVPPVYSNDTYLKYIKSNDYYYNVMKPLAKKFRDKAYLRTVTLGQLGSEIEFEIHNQMHMRWSSDEKGLRPEIRPFYEVEKIDSRWENVEYDWLNDFFASQVHPLFYWIHGWVDDRILDWQEANNVNEIQWKGTWVGAPNGHHMGHHIESDFVGKNIMIHQGHALTLNSSSIVNNTINNVTATITLIHHHKNSINEEKNLTEIDALKNGTVNLKNSSDIRNKNVTKKDNNTLNKSSEKKSNSNSIKNKNTFKKDINKNKSKNKSKNERNGHNHNKNQNSFHSLKEKNAVVNKGNKNNLNNKSNSSMKNHQNKNNSDKQNTVAKNTKKENSSQITHPEHNKNSKNNSSNQTSNSSPNSNKSNSNGSNFMNNSQNSNNKDIVIEGKEIEIPHSNHNSNNQNSNVTEKKEESSFSKFINFIKNLFSKKN